MHLGNSVFNQVREWRLLELQYKISVLKEMPCGLQIRTKKIFVSKEIKSWRYQFLRQKKIRSYCNLNFSLPFILKRNVCWLCLNYQKFKRMLCRIINQTVKIIIMFSSKLASTPSVSSSISFTKNLLFFLNITRALCN